MGSYAFRPGQIYQGFWPVDRLYPAYIQSTQVSTYTPLEPYHLELTGNNVRNDRKLLPRSDELPWISPGDAGTFPGQAFYYALLECLVNGSRGVNLWSSRVWDADLLAAYARAIRAVQPVEDILVDGAPFLPQVAGAGRVSGMQLNNEVVLLVADYYGTTGGAVGINLSFPQPMRMFDLDKNAEIGILPGGPQVLQVNLGFDSAKLLRLIPASKPFITGIVNDAGFTAGGAISAGAWVAIFGTGLAPAGDSRQWNEATEIVNGKLPLSLDGTSVTVNGKPAAVEFIQPSQVNIQAPDDTTIGPVQVIVNTAAGATDAFTVNYAKFAPGLFPSAQHADNSYVTAAAPAKPGEMIILWGTGFGPANPAVPAGQVFSGAHPLANPVTVTIGGQTAQVDFAGVVGAGLVQINVHVPAGINNGDAAVVATVGGISTQTAANMIPVHN
jgi:uncharacterized protein (TIGR03437 family)